MASDTSERKAMKMGGHIGPPPPEPEHLPCPRCDSINTKFCYYNNYNLSQPRHFCKSCRRYWTHGGTLRDIPVGGGSRKNAKRSRPCTVAAANPVAVASFSSPHHDFRHLPAQFLVPFAADSGGVPPFVGDGKGGINVCGSYTSLLNGAQGNGLLALGGLGLGIGPGLDEVGFGLGRSVWTFPGVLDGGLTSGGGGVGMSGHTWQMENGESGFAGGGSGDCFALPDLAISTPGSVFK